MDGAVGAQYALQVAFQTLKERCQQFQQRIALLEEENLSLRTRQSKDDSSVDSLSEIDALKDRITELTEQKNQLRNHIKLVTDENKQLWSRLSKLSEANKSLGTKLNKISDTLTQHNSKQHTPVMRSKTFTIEDSLKKTQANNVVEENNKISLELEDISLKVINSIAKEKMELEMQCSEMAKIQNNSTIISSSFGIECPEESVEEMTITEIEDMVQGLNDIKDTLVAENQKLKKTMENLLRLENNRSNRCQGCLGHENTVIPTSEPKRLNKTQDEMVDKEIARQLESLTNWATPENSNNFDNLKNKVVEPQGNFENTSKICPVCSATFVTDTDFIEFVHHVETHFVISEQPEYEVV